ncbi:class I SAM-dependent methyltransferase [Pelagibacterium halotolerans]|uniref:class I SAM-dependent methyltransferase n=1 Tax=Pelagibacterium halotolerans TaxID=531813 RepID=UPI0005A1A1D6|nr:methyltransferase domain-containing protein [Pelagibacterium halotolerans]QJR17214.1 class I SAM-dependent methyltransferase [Pelagibacterium halotolerans]SEA88911.1 hypothetical protein SAMN05428936_11124 [Pelagibacterium halotolerans]
MNFRIETCLSQVAKLPGIQSVLDVGCRDAALASGLSPEVLYEGADLFQNSTNTVKYVGDFLQMQFDRDYDLVTALDVIEHVDQAGEFVDKLVRLSKKYTIITLPNTYSIVQLRSYFSNGNFGLKYKFDPYGLVDRHRWLPDVPGILKFYADVAERNGVSVKNIQQIKFSGPRSAVVPSWRYMNVRAVMAVFER